MTDFELKITSESRCNIELSEREALDSFDLTKDKVTSCFDLMAYKHSETTWSIKSITLRCKQKVAKCKSEKGNICVPKCCPISDILDFDCNSSAKCNAKCITPQKALGGSGLPTILPIHDSKLIGCPKIHNN